MSTIWELARDIDAWTGRNGQVNLPKARLARWKTERGSPAWSHALAQAGELTLPESEQLRDREAAAATRAAPLLALEAKGVSARDWLATAREEASSPLLIMIDN